MTKKYTTGDYTNCRYDICEILEDGKFFCIVGTDYVENIIDILEENEQLQLEVSKLTDLIASEIEKNARLLQENNSLKIENKKLEELKE